MIGILICCHGEMAAGVKNAAELIVGPQPKFEAVGISPSQGRSDLKKAIKSAIAALDPAQGILILTDLPGGTPCNEAAMLLQPNFRMVAGFNLPLLLKVLLSRQSESDIAALTDHAAQYGAEHIIDFPGPTGGASA